jgi:hypothetical protein
MNRSPAYLLVAAALAGCHGPTILEADGGATGRGGATATAGASGAAGRGGATGGSGATAGASGAGCAAQNTLTPAVFYRGELPPAWTEGTAHRYYWAEKASPNVTLHYAQGDQPVEVPHPFKIDATMASNYLDLAASDDLVAGIWNDDGKLAVWGPDATPTTATAMMTLSRPGAVALAGPTVYYSHDPTTGSPTPGVYQWPLSSAASLFKSFTSLGGTASLGRILRATGTKLLFSDRQKVYMVDRAGGSPQLLFQSASNPTIKDIRPARPHSLDAGVIVAIADLPGHDYYVDVTQPARAPTDLSAAAMALGTSTACGYDATFVSGGVLFNHRYVYEGQFGLFAVDVAADGTVSNMVRLLDTPYRYLEVTGDGDLFGSWPDLNNVGKWEFSRIGRLAP